MKYVDGVLEFDRVHRSIGISAMVLDYFEDPWSLPSPRFRAWVLATKLRNAESGSNFIDRRLRKSQQVILAGSGPEQWLLAGDVSWQTQNPDCELPEFTRRRSLREVSLK